MYGILVDVTRCVACEKCVAACVARNKGNSQLADRDRATTKDGLSSHRRSAIISVDEGRFARKSCMHCLEPACVSACLVGSLKKTADGPVIYDKDKCIGCRYCMLACPFHVPRYEWDQTKPFVTKCDLCYDRIEQGQLPACVEACPEGVLKFGDRDQLMAEAKSRIKAEPNRYRDHVWGEKEFGGTSVIYISDVDLAELNWPDTGADSIPELTEPLVHKTPFIGLGVAVGLISLNWIVKRRNKLAGDDDSAKHSEENHE
ncbi:MAG TPA: 4Fe-4S dicluster domain-containing protein [candidate division Zixibacteria bacterium]|mgnify:CR=1 FL=1|nr:4Fe-4S dicluster domain-containing protein [candidate division Zixibacteria bacterium]